MTAKTRVSVQVFAPFALLVLALAGLVGCGGAPASYSRPSALSARVATSWYSLLLRPIQETPGFSPPVAARAIGYTGVTLYEAIVPAMTDHRSLAGQLTDLAPLPPRQAGAVYDEEAVASAAVATILRYLFANLAEVDRLALESREDELNALIGARVPRDVMDRSIEQVER